MNTEQSMPTVSAGIKRGEKFDPAQKIKVEKAVREFESVFVGYLLKGMRNTIQKADNSTESYGGEMLESMFDVELAKHISQNSHLGIADMLYLKMTGESLSKVKQAANTGDPAASMVLLKTIPGNSDAGEGEIAALPYVAAMTTPARKTVTPNVLPDGKNQGSLDQRLRNYDSYIAEASEKFGVSDSLIKAVIVAESSARSDAQSSKNAKGLMQLIDSTATEMGVKNVWDPRENILGGAKYLGHLLEKFDGDEKLAIASYNAGPGAVQKHGGIPPYKETKEYVTRVMNFFKVFEQRENDNE